MKRPKTTRWTHFGQVVTRPGRKKDIVIGSAANANKIVNSVQGYEKRREAEDQLIAIGLAFILGTIALHGRVKQAIDAAREEARHA